jgi:hypothetical protein
MKFSCWLATLFRRLDGVRQRDNSHLLIEDAAMSAESQATNKQPIPRVTGQMAEIVVV